MLASHDVALSMSFLPEEFSVAGMSDSRTFFTEFGLVGVFLWFFVVWLGFGFSFSSLTKHIHS